MNGINNDAPNAEEFYEAERIRLQGEMLDLDPTSEEYGTLMSRLDQLDNHRNLVIERKTVNDRRKEKGFKHWIAGLTPNTVVEVLGGTIAYIGGIKLVTSLEKGGGAFVSGAKSLFSKVRLRI